MDENFIYLIIHDLKEPLRTTKCFFDLLYNNIEKKKHLFTEDEIKQNEKYKEIIYNSNSNMSDLIDGYLQFYRADKESIQKQSIKLSTVVNDIRNNLGIKIKKNNVKLRIQKDKLISISEYHLSMILYNLISNAIKFVEANKKPYVRVACEINKDKYIFAVKDNGVGIPSDKTDLIFQPLKRLYSKDEYPGTGIGLALVKKLVDSLHGKIYFKSEINKGTTFFVEVPR